MSTLITLFFEFFKIGIFSVGGGLATLPYLEILADKYPWFSRTELIDMIAISESTPGPIGVNMATFAGYRAAGIIGGVVATLGIVAAAVLVIGFIATILDKFKDNKYVNYAFYGIRACVAALVLSSCIGLMQTTLLLSGLQPFALNIPAIIAFAALLWGMLKFKKHPIVYIGIAALLGMIIPF